MKPRPLLQDESRSFTNSPSAVRDCLAGPMGEELRRFPTPAAAISRTCGVEAAEERWSLKGGVTGDGVEGRTSWCRS